MIRSRAGLAWIGIAVYVIAYDYWAIKHNNETMSAAFGRSLAHPVGRWPTFVASAMLIKHLFTPHFLPGTDPFARLADHWRKGVELMNEQL